MTTQQEYCHMVQRRRYADGSFSFHVKKDIRTLDYYLAQARQASEVVGPVVELTRQGLLVEVEALFDNLSKRQANEYKPIVEQTHKSLGHKVIESKL
jgi:hypothetical protein